MTTSYKLEAVKALKAQKKEARAQEELELKAAREAAEKRDQANAERIAKKMARIEAGLPVEDPVVETKAEQKPVKKTATKKTTTKKAETKAAPKKRGRPKKSS